MNTITHVITRSGKKEKVDFSKVQERISDLAKGLSDAIDPVEVSKKTVVGIHDNVSTTELDNLSARVAAQMVTIHPDYSKLAARIVISDIHKNTSDKFSDVVTQAYHNLTPDGRAHPMVSKEFYENVMKNAKVFDEAINSDTDYQIFDFFGVSTLKNAYLLKTSDGTIIERPQHMFMRVAVAIHGEDIDDVLKTYKLMSSKHFIHATPTMFNAGTNLQQCSSCFLLAMQDDSIEGIYDTLKQTALISKSAGGIGISLHNVRAKGSIIKSTNGKSDGIVPLLRNFNETANYVNQGGKRKGSVAIYLEPWHRDIFDFLELKKNRGNEEMRAKDLFFAIWANDLFMKRVDSDSDWTLFSPDETPELYDTHGEEFERLYLDYEGKGIGKKIKARDLWFKIIEAQIETGAYYMLYKDHANKKSNQKNLGTIRSSNLCAEIIEYTSKNEVAVCNLASVVLNSFVKEDRTYDFDKLHDVVNVVTRNLNKVIDINEYPVKEAEVSNLKHRPIGIGVQGLADTFMLMKHPFESAEARKLNTDIFETIYHAAVEASMELAKEKGAYETFKGSPMSEGKFQFDLWNVKPESGRFDWDSLKEEVKKNGVRNSLLIALMPTASTAQILGNFESFEPLTSNVFVRRVLSGEFIVANKYLLNDLIELGIWNDDIKQELLKHNGSIQAIKDIPQSVKDLYKTVWEVSQKTIIDMAAERGPFVCQSQSMNIHMAAPTAPKMTSLHFHAWNRGLKTGMYYLRSQPSREAVKFTVDNKKENNKLDEKEVKIPVEVTSQIHTPKPEYTVPEKSEDSDDDLNICISCGS